MSAAWPFIILASTSPRRRALLEEIGARFLAAPVDVDEALSESAPSAAPAEIAIALAAKKGCARLARGLAGLGAPEACPLVVLAADTLIVAPDGRILGKPTDEPDARAILTALAGRVHHAITGVCLLAPDGRARLFAETSEVRLAPPGDPSIGRYLATGAWRGKAGAYGIQDPDAPVTALRGSRSNVTGLPLERLRTELDAFATRSPG